MGKLYEKNGWLNWEYLYTECRSFLMVVGPRGTGKTFGLMQELLKRGDKFIYMRRLKTQLDQCATPDTNPFRAINAADPDAAPIMPFRSHGAIRFCRAEIDEVGRATPIGPPVCIGVALSTFATLRGADFSDITAILFDEAVPMAGEKPIRDEFNAFLNFFESVNRNRELTGKQSVKCFLLGNANKLANPYFTGWGFMSTALKMIKGRQMLWRSGDNTRIMVLMLDSPISARKKDTALYRNANSDFLNMAIDNAFRTDATNIRSAPLRECVHLVSVGEIGIYRHKGTGAHYVMHVINRDNYYEGYGMRLTQFCRDYAILKMLYLANKIWFENYEIELIFRAYFALD